MIGSNSSVGTSSDFEAREFDLGTTSIRLVRVGNVIQLLFSNKLEAKFFYDSTAARSKRIEDDFNSGNHELK